MKSFLTHSQWFRWFSNNIIILISVTYFILATYSFFVFSIFLKWLNFIVFFVFQLNFVRNILYYFTMVFANLTTAKKLADSVSYIITTIEFTLCLVLIHHSHFILALSIFILLNIISISWLDLIKIPLSNVIRSSVLTIVLILCLSLIDHGLL